MRTPLRKLFSAMLACAITIGIAPVTAHAEGEDADTGYNVTIQYDESTKIHSVTKNGTTVILYCLQNKRHWPHRTDTFSDPPLYREISFQEFCKSNSQLDAQGIDDLSTRLTRVLYAGYDYNGLGLYPNDGTTEPLTAEYFNHLLSLSSDDPLRTAFQDTIGQNEFTIENLSEEKDNLTRFYHQVFGLQFTDLNTYSELVRLPFFAAVSYLVSNDFQISDIQKNLTPYTSTSNTVWTMMNTAGIKDTNYVPLIGLGADLLNVADQDVAVLTQRPEDPALTSDAEFTKVKDGTWKSSAITLTAKGVSTRFTLSLPSGITAVDGSGNWVTEVKPGESFSLVSSIEPKKDTKVTVSSFVPWMDENGLVVYEPANPLFQNMVGVVIHTEEFTASTTVQKGVSLTFTKKWVDDNNASEKRPDTSSYAKSLTLLADRNELSGYEAEITDNGNNTYTVSYKGLPKMLDGKAVVYSVKEAAVEGYNSDSSVVSDGGTLTNTLVVPTPAPTATVTVKENKPVRAVSPAVVKPVPPTGVESSYGENGN